MDLLGMIKKSTNDAEYLKYLSSGDLHDPDDAKAYKEYVAEHPLQDTLPGDYLNLYTENKQGEYVAEHPLSDILPGDSSNLYTENKQREYVAEHSQLETIPDTQKQELLSTEEYEKYLKENKDLLSVTGDASLLQSEENFQKYLIGKAPLSEIPTGALDKDYDKYKEEHPLERIDYTKTEYTDYTKSLSEQVVTITGPEKKDYNEYIKDNPTEVLEHTEKVGGDFSEYIEQNLSSLPLREEHVSSEKSQSDLVVRAEQTELDEINEGYDNQKKLYPTLESVSEGTQKIKLSDISYLAAPKSGESDLPKSTPHTQAYADAVSEQNAKHVVSQTSYSRDAMKYAVRQDEVGKSIVEDETERNNAWEAYAQAFSDTAVKLKAAKNDKTIAFKKSAHMNTNVKMLGSFIPNPNMVLATKQSSAADFAGGIEKFVQTGLSTVSSLGGKAQTAMSWLNWTVPSYAYILPGPAATYAWNKANNFLGLLPANPSDASLAAAFGDAANQANSIAENFNRGYNKRLLDIADARAGNFYGKYISLAQDAFDGKRVAPTEENFKSMTSDRHTETKGEGQVYHYGLRKKGSDCTGAKLREKRYGYDNMTDVENLQKYDRFTFYEFTYPLVSSITKKRFRGALTNIGFEAGKQFSYDFLISRPDTLESLPRFGTKTLDFSHITDLDLTSTSLGLFALGNDNDRSGLGDDHSGIQQGPWNIFNTYKEGSVRINTLHTTIHETEDLDVFKWMRSYHDYYFYQDQNKTKNYYGDEEQKIDDSYKMALIDSSVHRSPYESFYYIQIMVMSQFEPRFWSYVFAAIPSFNITVSGYPSYGETLYKTYSISWKIIGQSRTKLAGDDEMIADVNKTKLATKPEIKSKNAETKNGESAVVFGESVADTEQLADSANGEKTLNRENIKPTTEDKNSSNTGPT